MGREVRRVPANWQHPKDELGHYQPMYDEDFETAARRWLDGCIAWDNGTHKDLLQDPELKDQYPFYWQWAGEPPNEEYYRPKWTDEERTHLMMYEDTSEGTPISPAFKTPEELARWLADNKASSFGDCTASYEQWLAAIKRGWTPGGVMDAKGFRSGVEAITDH